jgi:hypothetical protein
MSVKRKMPSRSLWIVLMFFRVIRVVMRVMEVRMEEISVHDVEEF